MGAIYTVPRPIRHNPGVSLPLIISGHGFCGHPWLSRSEGGPFSLAEGRTDTSTRILGAIYTVHRPIRHNPGVSLPLIISGHGICGHPWLSRSEGGTFLFGCQGRTDTSTRILGAIYTVPRPIRHNPGVSLPLIISGHGFVVIHGSLGQREVLSLWLPGKD